MRKMEGERIRGHRLLINNHAALTRIDRLGR
jgi:hypothetical protein